MFWVGGSVSKKQSKQTKKTVMKEMMTHEIVIEDNVYA